MTYPTEVHYAVKTTKELIHWGVIFYVHRKPVIGVDPFFTLIQRHVVISDIPKVISK